ncbi:hypothetical protein RI543_004790 [Arxiozyma heterogenica]|uniref:Uncharacterized protein n=1 Tax=Arxiozyma heterogenica TaxID=278026 RepID=A0AAN7WLD9_9SACH|nr:hypothetical protein RI543_004790 [Kazachstania heterogenica]
MTDNRTSSGSAFPVDNFNPLVMKVNIEHERKYKNTCAEHSNQLHFRKNIDLPLDE